MILGILASAIQQTIAPVATDPLYANVFALLHANSSTPIDSGPASRAITGTLPMAPQSKFGGGAFDFSANVGSGLTIEGGSTPGMQGDLTTEFWLYQPAAITSSGNLFYFRQTAGDSFSINYYIRGNGYLAAYNSDSGPFVSADLSPFIGQWVHVAITRTTVSDRDTHTIFVNGKKVASGSISLYNKQTLSKLYIGAASVSNVSSAAPVYIDEVRITQAIRYTQDFIVPTAPFPNQSA